MIYEPRRKRDIKRYHRRPGRRVQGSLQPWLLLMLLQKPSYGYELMERLSQDKRMPDIDPGFLYRTLRHLENAGVVHSSWDMEGGGPARRLYQVTPEGSKYLHTCADDVRLLQQQLVRFLAEYEAYFEVSTSRTKVIEQPR